MHEPEREKEDGDTGHLGNNFGNVEVGNALAQNIVGQTDLGEARITRLDGFKEKPASSPSFLVNPGL